MGPGRLLVSSDASKSRLLTWDVDGLVRDARGGRWDEIEGAGSRRAKSSLEESNKFASLEAIR